MEMYIARSLQSLAAFCATQGVDAWLVGGAARDLVLKRPLHDLDIAVAADGLAIARRFADATGGAFVALDDERGTGRIVYAARQEPDEQPPPRLTVDIARLRAPTLAEDLRLRDFTINALALPLPAVGSLPAPLHDWRPNAAEIIDPCGGLHDLRAGTLRLCSPASLRDDPLRLLRALRLAAELAFDTTPIDDALREAAPLIERAAAERVRDELLKLLAVPHAARWLRHMDSIGLLTRIFPELEPARHCHQPIVHFLPVLAHSLETVACIEWLLEPLIAERSIPDDQRPAAVQTYPDLPRTLPFHERLQAHVRQHLSADCPRLALLKLATLLHDNAKPATKEDKPDGGVSFHGHQSLGADTAYSIARRLRLSRTMAAYVSLVVRDHMRPGQLRSEEHLTMRAIVRFFRDTRDAGPDVLLHALADHMATRGPFLDTLDWQHHLEWTARLLDIHWGKPPERTRPLVNGYDLMAALALPPGRLVGDLLREIHEAQAAGDISTQDEAFDLARRLVAGRI